MSTHIRSSMSYMIKKKRYLESLGYVYRFVLESDFDKKYCKFGNFRENFIFAIALKVIFAWLKIRD